MQTNLAVERIKTLNGPSSAFVFALMKLHYSLKKQICTELMMTNMHQFRLLPKNLLST